MASSQFPSFTEKSFIYSRLLSAGPVDPEWALQESSYFSSILSSSNCVTTDLPDLSSLLSARPNPRTKAQTLSPELSGFTSFPSNPSKPLLLFDQIGRPVAARIPLYGLVPALETAIKALPLSTAVGKSVATRGGFKVFTYGVHADYSRTPRYNADYIAHQPASSHFIFNDAKPAIEILSRWYRFLDPVGWVGTQAPVLPPNLERIVAPWTTMSMNVPSSRGAEIQTSVVNKPHVDGLDRKESMTGVIPFRWDGNWEKGKAVLFPLKTILEVGRGEAYLMFGAVTLHGNLPDEKLGRGSLVMHSRASIQNWWDKQQDEDGGVETP